MPNITINNYFGTRRPFADGWIPPFSPGNKAKFRGAGWRGAVYTVTRIVAQGSGKVDLRRDTYPFTTVKNVHHADLIKV